MKLGKLTFFIFPLCTLVLQRCVCAENILVYGLIASHSARISMMPLMNALTNKGHNVTYLSPFGKDPTQPSSKVHIYEPKKWKEVFGTWEDQMGFFEIRKRGLIFKWWYNLRRVGVQACQVLHSDPEYLEWVGNAPKFDMVIVEISLNECAYALVRLWGSKLVIYSTTTVVPWMMDIHGIPDESSSISDASLRFPPWIEMSFFERLTNALVPILFTYTWQYDYLPKLEEITRQGLGITEEESKSLPTFWEVGRNTSLILMSTHFTLDFPRSLPPNFVQIGGSVVTAKQESIPLEMENFMNSGKHEFIYISFGTLAEFTSFDENTQLEFVNALRAFPDLKFIWKSSTEITVGLPENVLVTKWAPQQSLLKHPKIKAFITHAGMGSTTEAVHFAVPLICLPIHAEQELHANTVVRRGAGIKLEILTLAQADLEIAISEMLHNPRYQKAMSELSKVFKDRPQPALDNAVWWVEYVLRHELSNKYLVSLSVYQPWWKRRQVDVWLTIGSLLLMMTCLALCLLWIIFSTSYKLLLLKCNPVTLNKNKEKKLA